MRTMFSHHVMNSIPAKEFLLHEGRRVLLLLILLDWDSVRSFFDCGYIFRFSGPVAIPSSMWEATDLSGLSHFKKSHVSYVKVVYFMQCFFTQPRTTTQAQSPVGVGKFLPPSMFTLSSNQHNTNNYRTTHTPLSVRWIEDFVDSARQMNRRKFVFPGRKRVSTHSVL